MQQHNDDIAYFIAFCIELYKNAHKITGAKSLEILEKHGIPDYLASNFDTLHTQSPQWILEEIEDIVSSQTE